MWLFSLCPPLFPFNTLLEVYTHPSMWLFSLCPPLFPFNTLLEVSHSHTLVTHTHLSHTHTFNTLLEVSNFGRLQVCCKNQLVDRTLTSLRVILFLVDSEILESTKIDPSLAFLKCELFMNPSEWCERDLPPKRQSWKGKKLENQTDRMHILEACSLIIRVLSCHLHSLKLGFRLEFSWGSRV